MARKKGKIRIEAITPEHKFKMSPKTLQEHLKFRHKGGEHNSKNNKTRRRKDRQKIKGGNYE